MARSGMKVKFFDYPLQFNEHRDAYMKIIEEALGRGSFILGKEAGEFEKNLADFVGAKHAIGVGNCTDGILMSLYALGVGPGDEVISVSHTFVATIETIILLGAKPVLVDIADDHNMDVEKVEAAITPQTKAIVPVQLNGRVCGKMDLLVEIAEKHGIFIMEDSAQAIGAKYRGKGAGTFGVAGCFSFYPAKILGAFGDAGAIVTNDVGLSQKLRKIRDHGRGNGSEVELLGMNSRIDALHAAVLSYKLSLLNEWISRRREIAAKYDSGLKGIEGIKLPPAPEEGGDHYDVYQNYEIEAYRRDELKEFLRDKRIETSIQWGGKGVHQFKALGLKDCELPRTEDLMRKGLLLPIYPGLKNDQVEYVIDAIRKFYEER